MKLKFIQAYQCKDLPDHIIEEVRDTAFKMHDALNPICEKTDSNIYLAALNFTFAAYIKHLVSDDEEQFKAGARLSALALIKNLEMISGLEILVMQDEK